MCVCVSADENKRVTRLCEVQDGSSSMLVCGLSLAPSSLNALLRALKLQASLTELRISGNRLHDNLLTELVATTITMPRLQLLDISANHITGEGLEKAVNALKGHGQPAFPVKCFFCNFLQLCSIRSHIFHQCTFVYISKRWKANIQRNFLKTLFMLI